MNVSERKWGKVRVGESEYGVRGRVESSMKYASCMKRRRNARRCDEIRRVHLRTSH